jgi:hypothetical protein
MRRIVDGSSFSVAATSAGVKNSSITVAVGALGRVVDEVPKAESSYTCQNKSTFVRFSLGGTTTRSHARVALSNLGQFNEFNNLDSIHCSIESRTENQ